MRVWLDDVREMPEGFDYWARTAHAVVSLLLHGHDVTYISFDHDLGQEKTGYSVATTIESMIQGGFLTKMIEYDVHSANPVGRKRIIQAMESARRYTLDK